MTTVNWELYDALLAAGAPADKARKAAEAVSSAESRFDALDRKIDALDHKVERKIDLFETKISGKIELAEIRMNGEFTLLKWLLAIVLALLVIMMSAGADLMTKFLPLPH